MDKQAVLEHFKTGVAVAKAIGITKSAVSQWPDLIPEAMAYRIQAATKGKLKVNPSLYQNRTKASA